MSKIVLALMKRYGIPETLDAWLEIQFAGMDVTQFAFDAEFFEYLPERFRDEFCGQVLQLCSDKQGAQAMMGLVSTSQTPQPQAKYGVR